MDIQINIINELSKHEELLEYDSIHEWVNSAEKKVTSLDKGTQPFVVCDG